ncbi:hypothetical protein K2173_026146 [Erythroxylum novogranatense]|uniref:NAC domain-containing protein n=1 Tax=Erythroxylum novogranatense TaxID=1862640 RepID=A0AAV8TAK3_9ROSI|nr:hypothetical protein K2173_026146 [Erythroxylum novogranatense]
MMSLTLPPGSVFAPSEEQLCCYYLNQKNHAPINDDTGADDYRDYDFIKEMNVYEYHPAGLPECACYRYGDGAKECHWYFYVRESELEMTQRIGIGGYWNVRTAGSVYTDENVAVANVSVLSFYEGGHGKTAIRTRWVINEYADVAKGTFVVCRMFYKPRPTSAAGASPSGAKDHEFLSPDMLKGRIKRDRSADATGEVLKYQSRRDQVTARSSSIANVQESWGIQATKPLKKRIVIFLRDRIGRASPSRGSDVAAHLPGNLSHANTIESTRNRESSAASGDAVSNDPSSTIQVATSPVPVANVLGPRSTKIILRGRRARGSPSRANDVASQLPGNLSPANPVESTRNRENFAASEGVVSNDPSSTVQVATSSIPVAHVPDPWGIRTIVRRRRSPRKVLRGNRARASSSFASDFSARLLGNLLPVNTVEATRIRRRSAANEDDQVAKHHSGEGKHRG